MAGSALDGAIALAATLARRAFQSFNFVQCENADAGSFGTPTLIAGQHRSKAAAVSDHNRNTLVRRDGNRIGLVALPETHFSCHKTLKPSRIVPFAIKSLQLPALAVMDRHV